MRAHLPDMQTDSVLSFVFYLSVASVYGWWRRASSLLCSAFDLQRIQTAAFAGMEVVHGCELMVMTITVMLHASSKRNRLYTIARRCRRKSFLTMCSRRRLSIFDLKSRPIRTVSRHQFSSLSCFFRSISSALTTWLYNPG